MGQARFTVTVSLDTSAAERELERMAAEIDALGELASDVPGVSIAVDFERISEHLAQRVVIAHSHSRPVLGRGER